MLSFLLLPLLFLLSLTSPLPSARRSLPVGFKVDESLPCVIKDECGQNDDSDLISTSSTSPLVTDASTSGGNGNVNCILNKLPIIYAAYKRHAYSSIGGAMFDQDRLLQDAHDLRESDQHESTESRKDYNRLIPGARTLFSIIDNGYCAAAAKRLSCWISIQKCDKDGDNRLRVCHSACRSYNAACGTCLDCSDQTPFSSEEEGVAGGISVLVEVVELDQQGARSMQQQLCYNFAQTAIGSAVWCFKKY